MGDETPQGAVSEASPQWGVGSSVVVTSGPSRAGASRVRKPRRVVVPLLILLTALLMGATGAVAWLLVQTRDRLQARERELVLVGAERDELRTQVARSEEGRARAEREVTHTRQELTVAQGELARVNTQREELSRSLEERQRQLDQMTAELDNVRKAQAELTRQVSSLSGERTQLQQQVTELQGATQALASKVSELSLHPTVELDKVLVSGAAPEGAPAVLSPPSTATSGGLAPPPAAAMTGGLTGQVVVVNREYDFIVMSLGRNHGLAVGQELKIVRNAQELGRVRVEKVYDELSAAALLPNAQEDQIQEGDAVVSL